MILRIIALIIVVCLSLGTLGLANGKPKSNLDTLKWERSIRTHIFLGVTVGLLGCGAALAVDDEKTRTYAIGGAVIGFAYAFFSWMRLQALG